MPDYGLLEPGTHHIASLTDDDAFLRCLVEVEIAWVRAQAAAGLVSPERADAVSAVADPEVFSASFDPADMAARSEGGGNPVIPMLGDLRAAVKTIDPSALKAIHRGLTSQDVMDTALMLMTRRVLDRIRDDLDGVCVTLAHLAEEHRATPAVARTLTQHALPSTFGLRCARWLQGLLDAREALLSVTPMVSVGGAAGTLAGTAALLAPTQADRNEQNQSADEDLAAAVADLNAAWASELGLAPAAHVWHTNRGVVLRHADALAETTAALGAIANDVLVLSRPEVAELREPTAPGRGVSSAMPQKQNPVLSVLIKRSALSAPQQMAQLHLAAAGVVDERPDGAWHAEWPVFRTLLRLSATAVTQSRELLEGLQVLPEAMLANLRQAGPGVVAERIAAVLGPVITATSGADGKAAVQRAIGDGAGDADRTVALLQELTADTVLDDGRAVTPDLLRELCDPTTYTGLSTQLVDAAIQRFRRAGIQSASSHQTN
ncbi:3-carboxy-cis,cis-muconate cycloisomerase [Kocuria soli]|uniref:3-carboxy-cis,cis-muconate cycloisomerase n=1 Tax=Kocuria soli TaxID=2485125 RepID=A0A3N4A4D7_9MICC|nr:lyase family protein [Kocuria soli]ROZ63479.1 3-carboxy-cis,cis-muconate cycloisomerase [Kocuria soli]